MPGLHADMDAQRFCETLYQLIIVLVSVIGFVAGYVLESFRVTVYAVFCGVIVASAICVPDWGLFKGKNPPQWLPEGCTERPKKNSSSNPKTAAEDERH